MKLTLLLFFVFAVNLYSQQPEWLEKVTHNAGLDSAIGTRILLADVDGDSYPDLLWGSGDLIKNHYRLYLNRPNLDLGSNVKRIFVDFTDSSGMNYNRRTGAKSRIIDVASLVDVDNDNDLDLVTAIYYHRLQMYQGANDPGDRSEVMLNDGKGHFALVNDNGLNTLKLVDTLATGLINATGMAFLDYDLDGKLDLYISTWFSDYAANLDGKGEYKMPDGLLKGNGDGTFTLVKNPAIDKVVQPMYGVNVTDWNNDGLPDIITSPYCRSSGSLFMNTGGTGFLDVAYEAGYTTQKTGGDHDQALCQWEAQPADFDNDGDMDLLQVEVHGGYNTGEGRTHITVNGGKANNYKLDWALDRLRRDAPVESHLGDQGGSWWDIDNDGFQDVVIGQMAYPDANQQGQERLYVLLQDSLHYFNDASKALGLFGLKEAHSMEPADFDLDGDLDLFFSHQIRDTIRTKDTTIIKNYMQIELLQNNYANSKNWIAVRLKPVTNKANLGARIYVYADGLNQMQELQAGLGHFAGEQPFIRHFGLGSKNRVDSVVVIYPGGSSSPSVFYNPPLNLVNTIESGDYVRTWADPKPLIHFTPSYSKFDTVNAGEQKTVSCLVKNIGETVLNINSVKTSNPEFVASAPSKSSIPPGQEAEIKVTFSPTLRRQYNEYLEISTNAQNGSVRRYDLRGFGLKPAPVIAFNSDSIDYGDVWYTSSSDSAIIIENQGELSLNIDSIAVSGKKDIFGYIKSSLPATLTPGEKLSFLLNFSPDTLGEFNAKAYIYSNTYEGTRTISLHGKSSGPAPQISLENDLVLFGAVTIGQSRTRDISVTNIGNAPLEISGISFVPSDTEFSFLDGISLPHSIEPDSSWTFQVAFTPLEALKNNIDLVIQSNSVTDKLIAIKLTATGKKPSSVSETVPGDGIVVYPNPASDEVFVSLPESYAEATIGIFNGIGCPVATEYVKSHSGPVIISTKGLYPGVYHVMIRLDNVSVQKKLVIVK